MTLASAAAASNGHPRSIDDAAAALAPVVALSAQSIHKSFGAVQALDGASLEVREAEIVGLIGPNGSGKTTMFNCVSGFQPVDGGTVTWRGVDVTGWKPQKLARHGLVRTFQHVAVFAELSVRACLVRAADCRRAIGSKANANVAMPGDVATLIEMCRLDGVAEDRVGNLSYGTQRLVNVAMALITQPQLLMLDEPAAGLSKMEADHLSALLRDVRGRGTAVCIVDHNMPFLSSMCSRIVVIDSGMNLFEGSPSAVRNHDEVRRVYLGSTG